MVPSQSSTDLVQELLRITEEARVAWVRGDSRPYWDHLIAHNATFTLLGRVERALDRGR